MNAKRKYDVLIMITPSDFERLKGNYKYIVGNINADRLFFVGPVGVRELVQKEGLGDRVSFICEDDILPFDSVHTVMKDHLSEFLNDRDLPRGMTGWYYQQFLKMQYARKCKDDYYMVWDGDTIPCRRVDMFDEKSGKPFFDMKKEYHSEYFDTIQKLFPGMKKAVEKSFISEHMLISRNLMVSMLEEIEANEKLKGNQFWEKIIRSIPPEHIKDTAFSEFETYGTYVLYRHPDAYMMRRWYSFRLGAEFFDPDTITQRDIDWLGKDFYAISFEKNQSVRQDHRNLFNNPEYQKKLTARQMLQIAQESFTSGYIEEWEDEDPLLSALKNMPDNNIQPFSPLKYWPVDSYMIYEKMGDEFVAENVDQAYLCYEYALFLYKAASAAGLNDKAQEKTTDRLMSKIQQVKSVGVKVKNAAFIILSNNGLYFTQRCLESIYSNCDPESYEVIILDNASDDGVQEWLKKQSSDDFTLLLSDENMGFAGGCNCAASYAPADHDIFLLNNDTRMTAGAYFWMRMGLYSKEDIGAVGGVQNYGTKSQHMDVSFSMPEQYMEFGAGNNASDFIYRSDSNKVPADSGINDTKSRIETVFEERRKLSGFAMLIRRSLWDKLGGFDESFSPGYFEDDDLCERIKRENYRMIISKKSFIYHAGSQSFAKREDVKDIFEKNRKRFIDKWGYDSYAD